jgi:hypothetical protein
MCYRSAMLTKPERLSAAAVALSLLVAGCGREAGQENGANAIEDRPVPVPPIPIPQPPLDREQLLLAVAHAASDFAAGSDDSARQADLADKKFEFRIRFGCGAPGDEDSPLFSWSLNQKTHALKVSATPALSTKNSTVKTIAGDNFEAVEGFWIRKPWLLAAACPRTPAEAASAAGASPEEATETAKQPKQPQPTVGIAQFFTASDPRTMRRSGRPYEATKRLEEGDTPSGGFNLVLTGRLKALPNGKVINCTDTQGSVRPSCVISVEFGKVSIERADTHEQLAQWGTG